MSAHAVVTPVTAFPCCPSDKSGMPGNACETEALFETYHNRIFRYVLRMLKNRAEAEDLTQETFLRALQHRQALRDPDAVRGWLYRIATHACLDRLRQRKAPASLDAGETAQQVQSVVAPMLSGLEISERKETSLCVQKCLDYLPDHHRAVLLLYEGHSLTAPEIANLLGLKLTTVKMRLHRARQALQKVMECGCAISGDSQGVPVCRPRQRPHRNL